MFLLSKYGVFVGLLMAFCFVLLVEAKPRDTRYTDLDGLGPPLNPRGLMDSHTNESNEAGKETIEDLIEADDAGGTV